MNYKKTIFPFIIAISIALLSEIGCTSTQNETFVPRDPMPLDEIAFRLGLLKPGKITNKKIKKALNKIRLYAAILTIKRKDLTEIK